MRRRTISFAAVLVIAAVACSPQAEYGPPSPEPVITDSPGCYPGQCPTPEPSPSPDAAPSRSAPARPDDPPPKPATQVSYFTIALIAHSPFYRAEGKEGTVFIVPAGSVLRVINEDATGERPRRTFSEEGGAFGSPELALGDSWELPLRFTGSFWIIDQCCPFIRAELRVS